MSWPAANVCPEPPDVLACAVAVSGSGVNPLTAGGAGRLKSGPTAQLVKMSPAAATLAVLLITFANDTGSFSLRLNAPRDGLARAAAYSEKS